MTTRTAIAAIALIATAAPASAYRLAGEPSDLRKWFVAELPASFLISSVYDEPGIAGDGERDEVRAAFAEWASYPGEIEISFSDLGLAATAGFGFDGDNVVTFADPFDDLAPGVLGLTRTWYGTVETEEVNGREFYRILDVDIVFAEDHTFVSHDGAGPGCFGAADLRAVAAHEIGHLIGLGHSELVPATMYAVVPNCAPDRAVLDPDDRAGGRFIYPPVVRRDVLRDFVTDLTASIGPLFPLAVWRPTAPMPWTDDEAGIAVDTSRPLVLYQVETDERLLLSRVGDDVRLYAVP